MIRLHLRLLPSLSLGHSQFRFCPQSISVSRFLPLAHFSRHHRRRRRHCTRSHTHPPSPRSHTATGADGRTDGRTDGGARRSAARKRMTDAAAPARYQAWRWWTGAATAAAAAMIVRIVSAVTCCCCCCGGGGRDLGFKPMITRLTARGEGRGRDFFWLEGSGGARIEFFPTRARPIDAYAIWRA